MITPVNPTRRFAHPRCFWHPHLILWPRKVAIEGRAGLWRLHLFARPMRRWSHTRNSWLWAIPGTVTEGTRNHASHLRNRRAGA